MDGRGVKVAWWRILALRLRAMTGWGLNTSGLRQWARVYRIQAASSLTMMVVLPALVIILYNVFPRFGIGGSRVVPVQVLLRPDLRLFIYLLFFLLLATLSFVLSVLHLRRAKAGAHQPPATYYGMCLATAHAPQFRFFALIGLSRERAQWFALPIDWDTAIEPESDQLEVTYFPATGFVEQVKRTGAGVSTLTQSQENDAAPDATHAAREAADADDGEATSTQRRDITRMYRRADVHWCIPWGTSTPSMLALWLTMLICGVFCGIMPVVIIVATGILSGHSHRSDFQTVVIASVIMPIVGVGCLVYGVLIMRVWDRSRRADALEPATFRGDLICWTPRGARNGQAGDVLALAQAGDGARIVFRIPRKWAHRVWQGAGPIQVTFNPVSGRVLDYRTLTSPPSS